MAAVTPRPAWGLEFAVEELGRVTGEDLAGVVNRRAREGWTLERIDYIKEAGVRRPQMAFVFFSRPADEAEGDSEARA